ncbi:MAG: hypothetical protein H0T91_08505, partial [Propionibacteriaceae bacterium]|nr:hypothetical protein [Propionibacteriaceae bacterium]
MFPLPAGGLRVKASRMLLATLVLAMGLLVPGVGGPTRAQGAEPEALVSITLEAIDPALPQRDGDITLTGRVSNISKQRLYRLQAYFWRNQAPITGREDFDQALASASNEPFGARLVRSRVDLLKPENPYLAPGASTKFTVTAKVADLALSPTDGLYLMGVHVLENGVPFAVGRARVFVPLLSAAPGNTLQMTSVVTLNSKPSLVRRGVFFDDHLASEVAPGGRLEALLRAADHDDVSFAIDPQLVEEIQTMKGGYQVLSADGSTTDGSGQREAEQWLDTFSSLLANRDGYRLLYSSVDIAALTHAGQQQILERSLAASKTVAATASLPLLVWPGGGRADAETMAVAAALKPTAVLLSDASTKALAPLLLGPGQLPVVNYTSAAFGGGPGPDPRDTAVHLQQRILAETWIEATAQPDGATLGRVRVINNAAQANSDDANVMAPWIKRTTLSELLRSKPAPWSMQLNYPDSRRADELDPQQLDALGRLSKSYLTWQDLLVEPASAKASANAALARAASVRWRAAPKSFRNFIKPQQSDLDATLDKIKISATPRVITPKGRVSFPITIRNTLPASDNPADAGVNTVKVKMVFTSANSQRLTVQP